MQKKTDIIEEIQFLDNLHNLATVYESISTMKMQQIRKDIISSRLYVNNLMDIFSALQYGRTLELDQDLNSQRQDLKPLATVVITANAKFHGDILHRISNFFVKQYDRKGDLFVMGKVGRDYIKQYAPDLTFQEFTISDINFNVNDLKPILFHLLQYKKIHVYYALFSSIVEQVPTQTDVADIEKFSKEEVERIQSGQHLQYLYEPSAKVISSSIHNNVVAMTLLQTVSETHLARLASRMNAMEALLQKINSDIKVLTQRRRRSDRSLKDSKQQDRLSGMMFW